MYNILIWGTGTGAEKYLMLHSEILDYINIEAFVDGKKQNNTVEQFIMPSGTGKPKIQPKQIDEYVYDYIVVLSSYYMEIYSDAIELGVVPEKIIAGMEFYKKWRKEGFYYFKEKYGYFADEKKEYNITPEESEYIWVSWLQGLEAAPVLVQKCIESIKRQSKGKKYVFITMDNLEEYVEIPDYVMKKFNGGIIRPAFFSDIIRLMLLDKYGGLWVDATVFCMSDFQYLYKGSSFFAFRITDDEVITSSWFLYANKNHILVKEILYMVLGYCRDMEKMEHYYIFHYFFRMAAECYKEEWDKVPFIEVTDCYHLFDNMNNPYIPEKFQEIAGIMPVQKLNYRQYIEKAKKDTFYWHIAGDI